jgi:hypothetical protein
VPPLRSQRYGWSREPWERREVDRFRNVTFRPGAAITDVEHGVTYRATIEHADDGPLLRSIEVELHDPADPQAQNVLRRGLPVASIVKETARQLAADERARNKGHVFEGKPLFTGVYDDERHATFERRGRSRPDLAEVAEMVRRGATRADLADHYGSNVRTVERWVTDARKAGLLPPARRGRPRSSATSSTDTNTERKKDK